MHPLKGRKQTAEHIAKRVAALRLTAYVWTDERRAARSVAYKGRKLLPEHKANIAKALKGKQNCLGHKPTEAHRRKLSEYWANNRERHNHYVDGRGGERTTARQAEMAKLLPYRLWREAVFKRDDFTCVLCSTRGVKIHADHIKPYALFPELRLDASNGRTLCVECHRKQPTWGSRVKTYSATQPQMEV